MAKNDVRVTDNPKLKQKVLSDGNYSLYLDYYLGRVKVYDDAKDAIVSKVQRKREFLKLTILAHPRTPIEREMNNQTMELARKIRGEREQELKEQAQGYRLNKDHSNINFLDFFQTYIDNYTKKDKRMVKLALGRFVDFLKDTREYKKYAKAIKPAQIDREMVVAFTEYLQSRSKGEGAHTLYARFKKVCKYALEHDVFKKNPCDGVTIHVDHSITKDILSQDEMRQLLATHYPGENNNIRRAFTFSLLTGTRFCDVKDMRFSNIDRANRLLIFNQSKTKGHSENSIVRIPLNDNLMALIGEPHDGQSAEALIFPLPSYVMCLKALRHWTKRAGIDKHITWHCARHSAATAMIENGASPVVVMKILGHSSLHYTERYMKIVDKQKRAALDSLPKLDL